MKRLWRNSLLFKLFLSYFLCLLLLFGSFYWYSSSLLRTSYISSLTGRMEKEVHLLARLLPPGVAGAPLDAICRERARDLEARITIIDAAGNVLGDSAEASGAMENHANRPEVMDALGRGTGSSIRHSDTVEQDMLYLAYLDTDSPARRIIRLAVPLTEIQASISSLRSTLLAGLIPAALVGLAAAFAFSRHLSRRIERLVAFSQQIGDRSFPRNFLAGRGRDEIDVLEQRLHEMSAKIQQDIDEIVSQKEKNDAILRCMLEGVLVLDRKGRVALINDQARKMFRAGGARDWHGASVAELSRHPEILGLIEEVTAFDFSGSNYSKEVQLDSGQWFLVNAARLTDSSRGILGTLLVFHDMTEIKRFESMRSDFVANVSHELRTPLTAIRGYVETLLHTPPVDPKDAEHFLRIIERHAERLGRLTEDLLTLSDIESGKLQMAHESVAVVDLVRPVVEMFSDQAAKKGIQLEPSMTPDARAVVGDGDRLQQLLINLVDNALKYTPSGGRVTVGAREAGGRIEIFVSDTGAGIPEKDLPRLTERFYRVDKARSRELGGTGLGLAIVKHIAQAHDGELKIESALNQGTTARVFLPAAMSRREADGPLVETR